MAEPTMAGGSGGWEGTWDGAHLTEETAHAWLDGALTADSAVRAESHVASCADCGALVAEARGLVAAATRVLSALDAVPGGVLPQTVPSPAPAVARPRRRWWAGAPARAAAALLLVAGGSAAVLRSRGLKDVAVESSVEPAAAVAGRAAGPSPEAASYATSGTTGADVSVPAAAPLITPPTSPVPRRERLEVSNRAAKAVAPTAPAVAAAQDLAPPPPPLPAPAAPASEVAERRREGARDPAASPVADAPASAPAASTAAMAATQEQRAATRGLSVAGSGVIRGRVTDAAGHPLPATSVRVVGTPLAATTDDSGSFVIGGVRAGAARVQARRIGYTLGETGTTVVRADTAEAPLVLRAQSLALQQVVVTGAPERSRRFARATAAGAAGCWSVRADPAWERLGAPPLPARLRLVRGPGNAEGGTVEAADGRSAAWQRGTWAAAGDTVRIELRADAGGDAALRLGRATSGWRGPAGWTAPGSEQREVSIWIVPDRCPAP